MQNFAIFSPVLGLRKDIPSILMREAYTPDCQDVIWQEGEVHRARKRILEFTYQFPDKILSLQYYFKDSTNEQWFIAFTKRDIAYRDNANDRFVFLNKLYNTGTITITAGNLKLVTGTGTTFTTNVKAGDFLKIGAGGIHSASTWYEVDSVSSNTILYLKTDAVVVTGSAYEVRKIFSGSNVDCWSVIYFHEKLIATNSGVDNIIIWTGSNQVSDLACPYKTTFLYSYEERVLLVKEINHPFRIRWSGLADETHWTGPPTDDSGTMEVNEGQGVLTGCSNYKGNLLIFKQRAIIRAWNVESEMVFNKKLLIDGIGAYAPFSIIEMDNGTYFYANDNTFRFFNGLTANVISSEIDPIIRNMTPTFEQYIQSTLIVELNQILWAIPYATSQTNNTVLVYDMDFTNNNWGILDLEPACFGYFELTTTFDNWTQLSVFDSWTDWWWPSWMYLAAAASFPIDYMGGYDGKIYRLNAAEKDIGADYEGYQVLQTDLMDKKGLAIFKRLLLIQAYVRQEATGTLDFHIKRDDGPNFQSAGSVNLSGDREIMIRELPVDFLAKTFKIKVSAQNRFKFLGAIFKYELVGER